MVTLNILDLITGKAERDVRKPPPRLFRKERSPHSRKVWWMLNRSGHEVLTPWASREKRRRRAAGRVAKQARKVNRRYRATGGLR